MSLLLALTAAGGSGTTVSVPAGALTLTGYAPTVIAGGGQLIAVPLGTLLLTGYAPQVVADGQISPPTVEPSGGWDVGAYKEPRRPTRDETRAQREALGIVEAKKRPTITVSKAKQGPTVAVAKPPDGVSGLDLALWIELLAADVRQGAETLPGPRIEAMQKSLEMARQRQEEEDMAFVLTFVLADVA